jgi:hypothetical protein
MALPSGPRRARSSTVGRRPAAARPGRRVCKRNAAPRVARSEIPGSTHGVSRRGRLAGGGAAIPHAGLRDDSGLSPEDLARAAIADLLATPGEEFRAAAERVLRKNEELYRRLA